MKSGKKTETQNDFFDLEEENKRAGVIFFSLSIFFHGMFFCAMLFFQDFKRKPKPLPPVIQLDLVSFTPDPKVGDPARLEKASAHASIPAKPKKTAPKKKRPVHNIKADISLKQKPKKLKELMAIKKKLHEKKKIDKKKEPPKKQTPEESLADTSDKLEKQVQEQEKEKIDEALSRLEKIVFEQEKAKQSESDDGASTGTGKKGYKPIDLYHMVIGTTIEQNWVFNDILARLDQALEVRILIKILKSGEIRDIIYETRSGNRYLDESAKKAISKSNPLPQLPKGMYSYDVVLVFTPKGLK